MEIKLEKELRTDDGSVFVERLTVPIGTRSFYSIINNWFLYRKQIQSATRVNPRAKIRMEIHGLESMFVQRLYESNSHEGDQPRRQRIDDKFE